MIATKVFDPSTVPKGNVFYVTVIDGDKWAALLGPYDTHDEAERNVKRGKDLANERDPRACFYAYGVSSSPPGNITKTVFGD